MPWRMQLELWQSFVHVMEDTFTLSKFHFPHNTLCLYTIFFTVQRIFHNSQNSTRLNQFIESLSRKRKAATCSNPFYIKQYLLSFNNTSSVETIGMVTEVPTLHYSEWGQFLHVFENYQGLFIQNFLKITCNSLLITLSMNLLLGLIGYRRLLTFSHSVKHFL